MSGLGSLSLLLIRVNSTLKIKSFNLLQRHHTFNIFCIVPHNPLAIAAFDVYVFFFFCFFFFFFFFGDTKGISRVLFCFKCYIHVSYKSIVKQSWTLTSATHSRNCRVPLQFLNYMLHFTKIHADVLYNTIVYSFYNFISKS